MSRAPALLRHDDEGAELLAPWNGIWLDRPAKGSILRPGDSLGALLVLGRRTELTVPDGAYGEIVGGALDSRDRRGAVQYQEVLVRLQPDAAFDASRPQGGAASASPSGGLSFTAPTSGRFWRRPSPDAPPMVADGDEIATGHAVGLLEVMKTFTRLHYGGDGLPPRAKVLRVVPADGDDVEAGAILLEIEPS